MTSVICCQSRCRGRCHQGFTITITITVTIIITTGSGSSGSSAARRHPRRSRTHRSSGKKRRRGRSRVRMTHRSHRGRGAIFRRRRQHSTPTRFRTIEWIRKIRVPRWERYRRRGITSSSITSSSGSSSITNTTSRTGSRRRETHGRRSDGGGGGGGGGGEGGRRRHGIGHGRGGGTSASCCRRQTSRGDGRGVTNARGVATRRGNGSPPGRPHGRRRARSPATWMHVQPRVRPRRRGSGGRAVMCRRLPRGRRRRRRCDGTGGKRYTIVSAAGAGARAENRDESGDGGRRDPCASRAARPRGHGCKAGQDGCEAILMGDQSTFVLREWIIWEEIHGVEWVSGGSVYFSRTRSARQ